MMLVEQKRTLKLFITASLSTKIMIVIGLFICSMLIFTMIFGKFISPYDEKEFTEDVLSPPSLKHPMGTDRLGRDMFSRIIIGTYWSLSIAVTAVIFSLIIGSILGAFSGYFGGMIDTMLSLIMDALWVFPTFVLAVLIALVMGPGLINTALAVSFVAIPVSFRVIRSKTIEIRDREFIEAERMMNAKPLYIIRRHIAPYYTSSLLVLISLRLAQAILSVSGLGFLGLGIPPPTPEWGTELAMGRLEMASGAWWLTIFPGFLIFLAILGFNLLGEGLDEMLKPLSEIAS